MYQVTETEIELISTSTTGSLTLGVNPATKTPVYCIDSLRPRPFGLGVGYIILNDKDT
jgi:hypothetical protein